MEQFRKQLFGIALILLGIILSMSAITFDITIPILDTVPWGGLGLLSGVIGVIIVYKNR